MKIEIEIEDAMKMFDVVAGGVYQDVSGRFWESQTTMAKCWMSDFNELDEDFVPTGNFYPLHTEELQAVGYLDENGEFIPV